MRLYEINKEFESLYSLLEEIETDDNGVIVDNSEAINELYNDLKCNLLEKLDNSAYIIKELEVNSKALKDEAKRLTEKAKVFENRSKRIKALMKDAIVQSGEVKYKTDKFSFNVKTIEKYNYDNVNIFGLDKEFIRVKEEIDKTKIKSFVKAGGKIDGVRIGEETSLSIR